MISFNITELCWSAGLFSANMCKTSVWINQQIRAIHQLALVPTFEQPPPDTLKEETSAVPANCKIFIIRGNKLLRMTSYEKIFGNKLSR